MSDINDIKRFILRVLLQTLGTPMPEDALDNAIKNGMARPLASDIELARNQLQDAKFTVGTRDDFDGRVYWELTVKGVNKAKQLG